MAERNPLKRALVVAVSTLVALAAAVWFLPTDPQSSATGDASPPAALALTHARVFDGQTWLTETRVIVRDGRILDMGPDAPIPDDAEVLDVTGLSVLPGLIDAHTHTLEPALRDSLRFGVTTNVDMFTSVAQLPPARERRARLDRTTRADLFSAGTLGTVEGGHGTQYGLPIDLVAGPDDAARWIARRVEEQSDFIKLVYMPYQSRVPSLDLGTTRALIGEAHRAGLMVVAHISSGRGARDMLDAGIDGLVHVWADEPVDDAFLADARAADLFVVPTLAVFATASQSGEGARIADDDALSPHLRPAQIGSLRADFGARLPTMLLDNAIDNTRRLHEAGIPVLAGSDAPNPGTTHGASLHHELELLTRAGLSPDDALVAATAGPAKRFSLGTRGQLRVGARADLVIVEGDPRDDITATRRIAHVFKNGQVVSRALDESGRPADGPDMIVGSLGQFEFGGTVPDGYSWSATDDRDMGGRSQAKLSQRDAPGGALRVELSVVPGFVFPWAGFYFGPDDNQPRSFRNVDALAFRVRGTPGTYRVMFFNAGTVGAPPTVAVTITDQWQDMRIDLADLATLDRGRVTGIAIVAGPDPVEGWLELAAVSTR